MTQFVVFESLRRPSTSGKQDLRAWRFRDRWRDDNTTSVLAWASQEGCVLHEALCAHASQTEAPTAMGRMDDARELFETERPKGQFRYFGFCGHCLTERVPNLGWEPTDHDKQLLQNLRQRLNDMRLLQEPPVKQREMLARMRRYGSGTLTPKEFSRLLQFYVDSLGDDEPDLSGLVVGR